MKKLLALALCALLAVCAVVPAFAAQTVTEENPFEDVYYLSETLLNTEDNITANGSASGDTYYTLLAGDSSWATMDGIRVNGTFTFLIDITVEHTGTYAIAMLAEHFVSSTDKISVEPIDLFLNGKIYTMTPDLDARGIYYYTVAEDVFLEAGTYEASISRNWEEEEGYYRSSSVNSVLLAIADESDLGAPGEDTGAAGADTEPTAPATFDAALIALAVAGASAAVAVVSKKRR